MAFLEENNINYWETPVESPDMNPIENVWHELKHYLRKVHKPKNKEQLVRGIETFWSSKMDLSKCQKYIGHLRKVLPAIVVQKGEASGY